MNCDHFWFPGDTLTYELLINEALPDKSISPERDPPKKLGLDFHQTRAPLNLWFWTTSVNKVSNIKSNSGVGIYHAK